MTKTKPFIPKLEDLCKHIGFDVGYNRAEVLLAASNVDDIFRALKGGGMKAVRVNFEEMWMITSYIIANLPRDIKKAKDKNPEYPFLTGLKIITEGQVDKFFGVKLILEE